MRVEHDPDEVADAGSMPSSPTTIPSARPLPRSSFETTRWHVLLGARDGVRADVVELCRCYWYPAYAFIRSLGAQSEEAFDITQEMFAGMLRRNDFAKLAPERGRFRSWLRAAARNQLRNYYAASRPPPGVRVESMDALSCEQRYQLEPLSQELAPDQLLDQLWASALVARAKQRLRALYEGRGKAVLFDRLEPTLVRDESDTRDAELCVELGRSAVDLRQARLRMRNELGRLLREELREELGGKGVDPHAIDEELRQLILAVSRAQP
jgi:RNA polymerase sigma-70 factor (ECF subfamily)